jgi:hypothetical protein
VLPCFHGVRLQRLGGCSKFQANEALDRCTVPWSAAALRAAGADACIDSDTLHGGGGGGGRPSYTGLKAAVIAAGHPKVRSKARNTGHGAHTT